MAGLRLIDLGGSGTVTQNMYVYEYKNEMLLVDCGIGFPDMYTPGVDVLIPDISYLHDSLKQGKEIVGLILTHGHDDHIAATPYLLPELPEFPIFASPLTAAFAEDRMSESAANTRKITVVKDKEPFKIGTYFEAESLAVTHSVPDTKHYVISTPEGVFYHGTDFKIDPNPIDGVMTDLEHMAQVSKRNIVCALLDCLRVEKSEWVKSESTTGPAIENAMKDVKGKFILTLMSSHIHRIQQAIHAAKVHKRKVVFVGRSVERNVEEALQLKMLEIDKDMLLDKRHIGDVRDSELCVIIAGSQGQEGSSLMRAVYGDHPIIRITEQDKVVFSADAIPGNDVPYFAAIDELCRNGVHVEYPDINKDLHQSGHGSAPEQQEVLRTLKPQFVMPIGGADRHRVKFVDFVAGPCGYSPDKVLIPGNGDVLEFSGGSVSIAEKIDIEPVHVDGLGVGDVGNIVLSDRMILKESGIIVLIIPKLGKELQLDKMEVVSRGFVFMKEADEVVKFIKDTVAQTIADESNGSQEGQLGRAIERRLGRKLHKIMRRVPMIVPLFIDLH